MFNREDIIFGVRTAVAIIILLIFISCLNWAHAGEQWELRAIIFSPDGERITGRHRSVYDSERACKTAREVMMFKARQENINVGAVCRLLVWI